MTDAALEITTAEDGIGHSRPRGVTHRSNSSSMVTVRLALPDIALLEMMQACLVRCPAPDVAFFGA
jgi:hypothetical protein